MDLPLDLSSSSFVGVRFEEAEKNVHFVVSDASGLNSELHLMRAYDESVSSTLRRLSLNVMKKWFKKKTTTKRSKKTDSGGHQSSAPADEKLDVNLSRGDLSIGGEGVDLELSNFLFFSQRENEFGLVMTIPTPSGKVMRFSVIVDPPILPRGSIRTFCSGNFNVWAGNPLVVSVDLPARVTVEYEWTSSGDELAVLSTLPHYTPQESDVGATVRCAITPSRGLMTGRSSTVAFKQKVEKLNPEAFPIFKLREPFAKAGAAAAASTSSTSDGGSRLRVMTYNLLADLYTSQKAQQRTMWSYISDVRHLSASYRMPLLVSEILFHSPDVLLLQEVDEKVFDSFLRPALSAKGYAGHYCNKCGNQREGLATFWRASALREVDKIQIPVRELFRPQSEGGVCEDSGWSSIDAVNGFLELHPNLRDVVMEKVGTVAQFTLLKVKSRTDGAMIVVSNTHLFFHPLADHVRAVQALAVCRGAHGMARRAKADHPECNKVGIIMAGDFNSDPESGASNLLRSKSLDPSDAAYGECWKNLLAMVWAPRGDPQEAHAVDSSSSSSSPNVSSSREDVPLNAAAAAEPPSIKIPDSFPAVRSVYDWPGFEGAGPDFTNYTPAFVDTLDYIYCDPDFFDVTRMGGFPTRDDMEGVVGMPNERAGSDHVSVAVDLRIL